AKDLNKMSAKSSIKLLVPQDSQSKLYQWIAVLTGSKNALKGVGFFIGGFLLTQIGFQGAVAVMASALALVWLLSLVLLKKDLGKSSYKPKFKDMLSKSGPINLLSAARLFLFGARDLWFVIALPLFLAQQLAWSQQAIGTFLALWIIGYGVVQSLAPQITGIKRTGKRSGKVPGRWAAVGWAFALCLAPALLAKLLPLPFPTETLLVSMLLLFGAVFAVNSSLHSYLIVSYAKADGVSLDVGFYYMANAMGRLIGTVLSGYLYQTQGLEACLFWSSGFILATVLLSCFLPKAKVE
ncbi:MAG: organoarsenical effux MFS transporter ArsJ, partial [Pararheinheimera sp.]|nr:organoarsenical effux MFS transporter ArsJ [Rheinheimera sp.]